MNDDIRTFLLQLLEIVWVNVLLSGDNAVVIALATRSLPVRQRIWCAALGAAGAVVLRAIFTIAIFMLLAIPFIKLAAGVALLWIAVRLVANTEKEARIGPSATIWMAVGTIIVADAFMSLDNAIAIAAAANGSLPLIVVGLILSVPLIVFGATLVLRLLQRFAWLLWGGVALLGWVGGQLATQDRVFDAVTLAGRPLWGGLAGAIVVLAIAALQVRRKAAHNA